YVSHGRNTGGDEAKNFGNDPGSNMSSLGFYVTGETYTGSKGYSLRLDGLEAGYNDNLRKRAVVMHDADYVSEDWIKAYGRIGRSQGCPALPKEVTREVIDTIKDRTVIFAYYDDEKYLKSSTYLDLDQLMERFEAADSTATDAV
ncbi:MAG: murein L,D-transpeptidase catalytic domain family protein, partial [Catalinimonas sp.]